MEFEIEGIGEAYLISEDVIYEVLKDALVALKATGSSIARVDPAVIYLKLAEDDEYDEPENVIHSVIRKFATTPESRK